MNDLINIAEKNGQLVVSSRQVAENFGREHKNVLDAIRNLVAENSAAKFFIQTAYENRGKEYPEYLMTRDGFSLLVMGFTGSSALEWKLKYINAFNAMEAELNSPERIMARALRIAEEKLTSLTSENLAQKKLLEEQKPKALFADAVSGSDTSILVGNLAKLIKQNGIDIGQNRLFEWLRNNGYLIKSGDRKNMPTQMAMEQKLFEVKERTVLNADGSSRITRTPMVTGKGQVFFINKFLEGKA